MNNKFNFVVKLFVSNNVKKYVKIECMCMLKLISWKDVDFICVVFILVIWECLWFKCFGKIFLKCFVIWGMCLIIVEVKIYVSFFNNCFCLRREGMNVKLFLNLFDFFGLLVEYLLIMVYIWNKWIFFVFLFVVW